MDSLLPLGAKRGLKNLTKTFAIVAVCKTTLSTLATR